MNIRTDNSVLAYINLIDSDKDPVNTDEIRDFGIDAALNWEKTPESVRRGKLDLITAQFEKLSSEGFSNDEAEEMLLHRGYNADDVREITASAQDSTNTLPKIAKTYDDLKPRIEAAAAGMTPDYFIEVITANQNPMHGIVRLASKETIDLESLLRYISVRKDAGPVMTASLNEDLHKVMRPFVEEELFRSKLEAQVGKNIMTVAARKDGTFKVAGAYTVNLETPSCTCEKFSQSNYGAIGLPCEHILVAEEFLYD